MARHKADTHKRRMVLVLFCLRVPTPGPGITRARKRYAPLGRASRLRRARARRQGGRRKTGSGLSFFRRFAINVAVCRNGMGKRKDLTPFVLPPPTIPCEIFQRRYAVLLGFVPHLNALALYAQTFLDMPCQPVIANPSSNPECLGACRT